MWPWSTDFPTGKLSKYYHLKKIKKTQHKTVAVEVKYEQTWIATDMHVTTVLH